MAAAAALAPAELPAQNAYGAAFREYTTGEESQTATQKRVEAFYKENHEKQTYAFVQEQKERFLKLNTRVMGVWEAAELLNSIVDESDPDLDLPQIQHLLQTAEACRRAHPDEDWFHLAGFIHDLGKVLAHPDFGSQPQWAVVGDTFPVGCAFDPSIIYSRFFAANPDATQPGLATPCGVYAPGCGLEAVDMSWGHDEYMAQVMLRNGCTLPPAALYIVRYHSCYSIHRENAYGHLLTERDRELLHWVKEFNKHDLYSKSLEACDVAALAPYYKGLIAKYFPEKLRW